MVPDMGKETPSVESMTGIGPSSEEINTFRGPSSMTELPGSSMPDTGKFKIGSTPGDIEKFKIGLQAKLPDIRMQGGKVPDEEKDPNKLREEAERRYGLLMGDRGKVGKLDEMINGAKELKIRKKEEEKRKERKEMAENYIGVCHVFLDELDGINGYLENLRNPFPYDSRWTIQLAEAMLEKINGALRERGKVDEEGKAVLRMLKRDTLWTLASARVVEAMGPSYEVYYDGELQISQLRIQRSEILARDHMRMFSEELQGLEIDNDEKAQLSKLFTELPEDYRGDFAEGKIERSLGEEAIRVQDSVGDWLYKIAACQQKDLELPWGVDAEDNPLDKNMGENYAVIDEVTFRFLSKVFNLANAPGPRYIEDLVENPDTEFTYINSKEEKIIVARKMLNIFAMPASDENAMIYFKAALHELVGNKDLQNALEKIKSEVSDEAWSGVVAGGQVDELAQKIIDGANARIEQWETLNERGPYDRLIDTVSDTVVNLERGTFACGDLGWGYEHKKVSLLRYDKEEKKYVETEEYKKLKKVYGVLYPDLKTETLTQGSGNDRFMIVRQSELGSIYDNHDITTVFFLARHIIEYDTLADDRGTVLFGTDSSYRDLWPYMPAYWRPQLEVLASNDQRLLKDMGITPGRTPDIAEAMKRYEKVEARKEYKKGKTGLQSRFYDKFDEEAAKFINENAWALGTWVLDKPGDANSNFLCIPVFMPTTVKDLNYWRTTSLEAPSAKIGEEILKDGQKIDAYKESIWHQRLRGVRFSKMKWEHMPKYKFNYFRTTTDQLERWLGPMVTAHEYSKLTADQYMEHYNPPRGIGGMPEKRRGKRGRLGKRSDPYEAGVYRAVVLAQNAAFTAAKEGNLFDIGSVISVKDPIKLNQFKEEFRKKWVAPWVNTFLDMPDKVLKIKNYGGTAAMTYILTHRQLLRIGMSAAMQSSGQVGDVSDSIKTLET